MQLWMAVVGCLGSGLFFGLWLDSLWAGVWMAWVCTLAIGVYVEVGDDWSEIG